MLCHLRFQRYVTERKIFRCCSFISHEKLVVNFVGKFHLFRLVLRRSSSITTGRGMSENCEIQLIVLCWDCGVGSVVSSRFRKAQLEICQAESRHLRKV